MTGSQVLFIVLSAIYILSPVDALPGLPFDDLIAAFLIMAICAKAGYDPYEKPKKRRRRRRRRKKNF